MTKAMIDARALSCDLETTRRLERPIESLCGIVCGGGGGWGKTNYISFYGDFISVKELLLLIEPASTKITFLSQLTTTAIYN